MHTEDPDAMPLRLWHGDRYRTMPGNHRRRLYRQQTTFERPFVEIGIRTRTGQPERADPQ